ncbi:serpin family protein, partial [Streptomyces sp. T-3]|nr:serpin family protein [Streptomyces sp. T-3]
PGQAPEARVRFVLGEPGAGPTEVLPAAWADQGGRQALDAEVVKVALPRISLRMKLDVSDQLRALGVELPFSDAADFSGLSPEPLVISQVVQESVVKVAEHGIEAAAVTAIPMAAGAAPRPPRTELIAYDRPFGLVVLDGEGEVPLFVGWQAEAPQEP